MADTSPGPSVGGGGSRVCCASLERIAAHLPGVIYQFLLRPDGSVAFPYASPGLHRAFGVDPADIGRDASSVFSRVHPADLDPLRRSIRESAAALSVWSQEFRVVEADGTARWLAARSTPERLGDGSTLWHGFVQDVTERKRDEQRLRRLAVISDRTRDGLVLTDPGGRVEWVNAAFTRITGYDAEEVVGRKPGRLLQGPRTDPQTVDHMRERLAARDGFHVQIVNYRKDGEPYWCDIDAQPLYDDEGRLAHFVAVERDVSDRVEADATIREQGSRLKALLRSIPDLVFFKDRGGTYLGCNPAFERFVGREESQVIGLRDTDLFDREVAHGFRERDRLAMSAGRPMENEEWVDYPDGGRRLLSTHKAPLVPIDGGEPVGLVGISRDITDRHEAEQKLRALAERDTLTGLVNRQVLRRRTDAALRRARDAGPEVAMLFFDLDRFKSVNDTSGHEAGNALLRSVADRLRAVLRPGDTAARLGGDEFAVLLAPAQGLPAVEALAERLLGAIEQRHAVDGQQLFTSASIGIVHGVNGYADAEEMLRDADAAMYQAKAAGRGRYRVFDAEMHIRALRRARLERDLRAAAFDDQMWMCYQPIVGLEDGRVRGFEALLRWEHPELGGISPAEFIPIAEETGAIVELGRWVLDAACGQLAAWRQRFGDVAGAMNVNVSRRQLLSPGFERTVVQTLTAHGLDSRWLELEVIESAIVDDRVEIEPAVNRLRDLGVRVAIDDFGTGLSSLSALHRIPADTLKIDRSFIREMAGDTDRTAVVQAVIALADTFGLDVVAEGVESMDHVVRLQALGCPKAQGYWFARPMAADDATRLLAEGGLRSGGAIGHAA